MDIAETSLKEKCSHQPPADFAFQVVVSTLSSYPAGVTTILPAQDRNIEGSQIPLPIYKTSNHGNIPTRKANFNSHLENLNRQP